MRHFLSLIKGARASSPVLALVTFLALPAVAQTKHPFTFEDIMALKRVEEPEISPDGKWVLFAAVDVDLKANTKTPHVWVVPLNQTQGPSTPLGMTESREKEVISDQDADRECDRQASSDEYRDRSGWRAVVTRWEEHFVQVGCLSGVRWDAS